MSRAKQHSRIKNSLGVLALAAGALALAATPSLADEVDASPSDSEALCLEAGGDFSASPVDGATTVNTCVVETVVIDPPVPGGSNPNWKVELTHTTTTTYTTTWTEVFVPAGWACFNPAHNGIPMAVWNPATPLKGNPNCVAAYSAGGQQKDPPYFAIGASGEGQWVPEIAGRTADSQTETELTNCWNPGGIGHQNSNQCVAP